MVLKVAKSFFKHGKVLKETKITHIFLILKDPNVEKVEDYRPISLCNLSYKIIAKCLAEILKVYLP